MAQRCSPRSWTVTPPISSRRRGGRRPARRCARRWRRCPTPGRGRRPPPARCVRPRRPPTSRTDGIVPDLVLIRRRPRGGAEVEHHGFDPRISSGCTYRKPVPPGPRRNLRPFPARTPHPSSRDVDRQLSDRLARVQDEQHACLSAQPADLDGRVHEAALGGHVHQAHHCGVVRREGLLQRRQVDLAVVVVVHEHELAAGAPSELEERDGVGAVLGPTDQHAVLRLDRQRVHRHVPSPGGGVHQRDLRRPPR